MYYGDNMKKLEIAFTDTSEKVVIDETSLIIALSNKTTPDGLTESFILNFDEDLPDKLLKHPLMFYIYDDLPILKLYTVNGFDVGMLVRFNFTADAADRCG